MCPTRLTRLLLLSSIVAVSIPSPKPCPAADAPAKKEKAPEEENVPADKNESGEAAAAEVKKITIEEFDKMRREKGAIVLDVRTPKEFAAGHVPGAVNLNLYDEKFDEKVVALDKGKTYLVHCATGGRSKKATAQMRGRLKDLYEFDGGMKAWEAAGKSVEK